MRTRTEIRTLTGRTACGAAILLLAALASAPAQEPTPEEIAEKQRLYRELAQPGPEHEMLARMAGAWDQEIKMWPEPGTEPMVMKGVAESRLILGGRFLQGKSRMPGMEEPVGVSLLGFDRRSGEFTALGLDLSGTYWVTARGKPAPDGKTVVMSGEDYNPAIDHLQIYDFVLTWIDDDTYRWAVVFKDDVHTRGGDPFKMVEITFRRQR